MAGAVAVRTKAEYSSSIRSKERIRDAFFEMLQKKPVEKITVTDIIRNAHVNRGTFYAHYADIHQLLESIENEYLEIFDGMLEQIDSMEDIQAPLRFLLMISDFLEKNEELYRKLAWATATEVLISKMQDHFIRHMEHMAALPEELRNSLAFRTRVYLFAGGISGIYRAWMRGELDANLQEVAQEANRIILDESLLFFQEKK